MRSIFLDIGLPDKKGDDVIKEVRGFNAAIPFLVASGEAKADLRSGSMASRRSDT